MSAAMLAATVDGVSVEAIETVRSSPLMRYPTVPTPDHEPLMLMVATAAAPEGWGMPMP